MPVLESEVKRWGGSLAIRIDAADARRLGLQAGRRIHWHIVEDDVDLGEPPLFHDDKDASERHDDLLHSDP